MAYTSAWNTVVYRPMLKLSFLLDPWQYTSAPVPFLVLEPSDTRLVPPFCQVETTFSINFYQGLFYE
jgi:hypothetical protein